MQRDHCKQSHFQGQIDVPQFVESQQTPVMNFANVVIPDPWLYLEPINRVDFLKIKISKKSSVISKMNAPTVSLPIIRVPAIEVWTIGKTPDNSLSKTLMETN